MEHYYVSFVYCVLNRRKCLRSSDFNSMTIVSILILKLRPGYDLLHLHLSHTVPTPTSHVTQRIYIIMEV